MAGTKGRIYGGDPNLIHVTDGTRRHVGKLIATHLSTQMRSAARYNKQRTLEQRRTQKLCPGCYMVVGFNQMIHLARANDQSIRELALTMASAFANLALCADDDLDAQALCIEEIEVLIEKRGEGRAEPLAD